MDVQAIVSYSRETCEQIPENWQGVVAEYKDVTAGKDIVQILKVWLDETLKNYVNFNGSVSRKEYAFYFLPAFICGFLPLLNIAVIAPNIAYSIRRLRDLNLNPLWILIALIPVLGPIALLLLFLRKN